MKQVLNGEPVFQQQADAVLSQANPVSGTKYTVLDTTKNARIISMTISLTWTVQPSPLELHLTINGIAYIFTVANPASATYYYAAIRAENPATGQYLQTTDQIGRSFLLEGRTVKVEAETTGGTVQSMDIRVKYAKIP